ncbi:MAG: aspartate/glutamate racemase family protein [Alphaproteobacteria bacterium]|nr:aspartate/glutamate racemase family protein [Alphaproteobacteria bacterium]MDE2337166.1 aspartate/glutamate racemase family protein [Alphaproteobacteria bacterium]
MIGVFDSGFGGLTVHRALVRALPRHAFVYLGDNKNAPYGTRPPLDVLNLTCTGIERLFAEGCTLVIVACNTASVVALRWIQQQWLPHRARQGGVRRNVIGVVVPTIEAATGMTWGEAATGRPAEQPRTIGIFATPRTVETGVYPLEIGKRRPDIRVIQQACPDLAAAIEQGAGATEIREMVRKYADEFRRQLGTTTPDSVILGCTHYPLIAETFAEELPDIPLIRQSEATARALLSYLERHPEYGGEKSDGGKNAGQLFLSTGYAPDALPLIEKFWGGKIGFRQA